MTAITAAEGVRSERPASLWRDTLGTIASQRSAQVGLVLLTLLFTLAIFAPIIAPFEPTQVLRDVSRREGPSLAHLMGTDANFRDLFSRVVFGAQTSLQIGFVTVGFAIVIGTVLGAVAGYAGGVIDNIIMRIMDVFLAFPALVLAIAIVTVLGPGLINAMLAIGIVSIPVYARVMRASVLSVRGNDYITASRALGESSTGILFRRILPNSLTPLIVQGTLGIAGAILEVAALSFLGLGADPTTAEWGQMIGAERNQVFNSPHLILFPGLALALSVLGFNLLGDGIRDALDPRLNR